MRVVGVDATRSWTDSLLVSPFLPPSLPPPQTEQHQHCCPHLLCPPAPCLHTEPFPLGTQHTHSLSCPHHQQFMISLSSILNFFLIHLTFDSHNSYFPNSSLLQPPPPPPLPLPLMPGRYFLYFSGSI